MTASPSILIVDDEPSARRRILQLLEAHGPLTLVREAESVDAARAALAEQPFDLLFLDVRMPEREGFDLLPSTAGPLLPLVVFVTAHEEHALRAFEARAVDYLLKPIEQRRFDAAMGRVRETLELARDRGFERTLAELMARVGSREAKEPLLVREPGRVAFLDPSQVDWVDAAHSRAKVHAGPATYLVREGISSLESRLPADLFLRVHRSTIVNVARLRELLVNESGHYTLVLQNGQRLNVGRSYRSAVRQRFGLRDSDDAGVERFAPRLAASATRRG